jgi:hypothetical protein
LHRISDAHRRAEGRAIFAALAVDNARMNGIFKPLFPLLLLALGACQPALNWRESVSDASPLTVLLPCKPDKATREVPMAGQTVALDMLGCDAAGATFAVSHARLADPMQAGPALAGWRTVVLANMQATEVVETPFTLPGTLGLPQAVRLRALGRRADGGAVAAQAVWFARVDRGAVDVFHAVVYADRPDDGVANTFFDGLRLP